MLFSHDSVAEFINHYFEPAWESVRPVPIVRLDFGNGHVLTRTLHGNIATYACTADGQVLDIVPGIYTPPAYLARLQQFRLLANYVDQEGKENREARLREYHRGQAEALKKHEAPSYFVNKTDMDMVKKLAVEDRLEAILVSGSVPAKRTAFPGDPGSKEDPKLDAKDLAGWKLLAEDTRRNETARRRQIHELLASRGLVGPDDVKKPLYKDVLHADLDDPYLGLGDVLFANYPFADAEKPR